MTHEEAMHQMMGMIQMQQEDAESMQSNDELPQVENDQYIFKVKIGDDIAIFCVRDLTWSEALSIETLAFRSEEDELYFVGEYERREVLKRAIVWVYDLNEEKLLKNNAELNILTSLSQPFVDNLWDQYFKYINIDAKEANVLYTSAIKYFKGESQSAYPVIPFIVEVDYMLKGIISMSRDEFRRMSVTELEKLQLILTARADALGLAHQHVAPPKEEVSGLNDDMIALLPPHLQKALKNA
jgi:hypothetical protein